MAATAFTIARCPTDCSEVRIGQWIMKEQEKEGERSRTGGKEGGKEGRPFMRLPPSFPPSRHLGLGLGLPLLGTEVKFPSYI